MIFNVYILQYIFYLHGRVRARARVSVIIVTPVEKVILLFDKFHIEKNLFQLIIVFDYYYMCCTPK